MSQDVRLSFSAFETYAQCPLRFKKLYLERVREPSNKYALFGSAFHSLVEHLYETEDFVLSSALEQWPAIFNKEASKSGYDCVSQKDLREQEARGTKDIKTWFKMAEQAGVLHPCIEHEIKLEGNFKQSVLAARIDLVLNVRGGLGIIDWKTGNSDPKNLMQLALYAVLYYKKTGHKVDWLIPFYIKTKEVVFQACDDAIIKEAGIYFNNIYSALVADTEYLPKKGPICYFCSFSRNGQCPLFQRTQVEI